MSEDIYRAFNAKGNTAMGHSHIHVNTKTESMSKSMIKRNMTCVNTPNGAMTISMKFQEHYGLRGRHFERAE